QASALPGKKVLCGLEYLVLDPEIERFRRHRQLRGSTVVSLGGTDTYGVTVRVTKELARLRERATVILGPGFQHHRELAAVVSPTIVVKQNVTSLVEEFSKHDLAITGG